MDVVWTIITVLAVALGASLVAVTFFLPRSSRVLKAVLKANLAVFWLAIAALGAQVVFKIAGPGVDVVNGLRSFALPALVYVGSAFAAILVSGVRERVGAKSARRTEQARPADGVGSEQQGSGAVHR